MKPAEWTKIVERIQSAYQREVTPETASAWYDELRSIGAQEVEEAVRRVIRERHRLTVADIYAAVDANYKEQRDDRARFDSEARQRMLSGKRGVPPPPEFRKALRVFGDPGSWAEGRMRPESRDELDDLADKLTARGPAWIPAEVEQEPLPRDPSATR